jgi:hypothetical protein
LPTRVYFSHKCFCYRVINLDFSSVSMTVVNTWHALLCILLAQLALRFLSTAIPTSLLSTLAFKNLHPFRVHLPLLAAMHWATKYHLHSCRILNHFHHLLW